MHRHLIPLAHRYPKSPAIRSLGPLALLLTALLPATSLADTFTWAGNSANFSNPAAWLAPAPTSGGSSTDQLLFNPPVLPASDYTATLDLPTPWTLNALTFAQGVNFHAASGASLNFAGTNPAIIISSGQPSLDIPISTASTLAISGDLTLNAPISFTGPNPALTIAGQLSAASLPAAPLTFNDATLSITSASLTVLSAPITVNTSANIQAFDLQLLAPVSGPGTLRLDATSQLHIDVPIANVTSVILTAPSLQIAASITVSGPVGLAGPDTRLTNDIACTDFQLNGHLAANAHITAANPISLTNCQLAPGITPGDIATLSLSAPSVTLSYFASLELDLLPFGVSDQLLLTGDLDLEKSPFDSIFPQLALNSLAPLTGEPYTLLSANSLTGVFASVTGLPDGYTLQYTPTSILMVPVPEPTTLSLLLLSLAPLLRRRPHS